MIDRDGLAAVLAGQSAALATLVGLLIDKGVVTPEEVIEYFDNAADQGLMSEAGERGAQGATAIVEFVRSRTGAKRKAPS